MVRRSLPSRRRGFCFYFCSRVPHGTYDIHIHATSVKKCRESSKNSWKPQLSVNILRDVRDVKAAGKAIAVFRTLKLERTESKKMSGLTFSVASRRLLNLCRRQPSLTKMTQQQPRQEGGALNNLSLQQPRCLMSSEAVWKLGRLNHVAVATPDLAKTSAFYRDVLGAKVVTSY